MAGLYYDMTYKNISPSNRYAQLATIPVIEKGDINRDRYTIPGRDGELLGVSVSRNNAHVKLTLHTKAGWGGTNTRNLDDNLKTLQNWLSGTGELKIFNNKRGLDGNYITHILEVLQITTNEIRKDNIYGRLEVDFEVYPYNFVASGQAGQTSTGNTLSITNPYEECKPMYQLTGEGNGTLTVGGSGSGRTMGYTLVSGETLVIDTRRKIAYCSNVNWSDKINGNYEDLWLGNGTTQISVSSGHTFTVTPYWGYKL